MGFLDLLMCCKSVPESPRSKSFRSLNDVVQPNFLVNLSNFPQRSSPTDLLRKERAFPSESHSSTNMLNSLQVPTFEAYEDKYNQPLRQLPESLSEFQCGQLLRTELELCDVAFLSEGFYGMVFQGRQAQQIVACKVFNFGKNWSNNRVFDFRWDSFTNEMAFFKRVSHPHIVKWFSTFQIYCKPNDTDTDVKLSILKNEMRVFSKTLLLSGFFMEKLDMNLNQWMNKCALKRLGEIHVKLMFQQIGKALQYLNTEHFACHQDMKPANIGVQLSVGNHFPRLVLLDFGNAKTYDEEEFNEAELRSNTFNLNIAELQGSSNIHKKHIFRIFETFDLVPSVIGGNAFLLEAYHFARLLMMVATLDSDWRNFDDIRANFASQCHFTDRRLKAILMQMSTAKKEEQVSINWAMNKFENGRMMT